MRVVVAGGTGFVGSHSVQALVAAGHDVRLLVRAPERIAGALEPLGVTAPEHADGDVTDEGAVRRALEGCDAVLHAASVFSLRRARGTARAAREPARDRGGARHRSRARAGSDRPRVELRRVAPCGRA